MDDDLAKIVREMPRARLEAEGIEDFPLEAKAARPGPVDSKVEVKDSQRRRKVTDLSQATIESIGQAPEAKQSGVKRVLPPLSLTPKKQVKRMLTFDAKRRDIVADREAGAKAEAARAELSQAVAKMPMRWEK